MEEKKVILRIFDKKGEEGVTKEGNKKILIETIEEGKVGHLTGLSEKLLRFDTHKHLPGDEMTVDIEFSCKQAKRIGKILVKFAKEKYKRNQ
jgi:hypothetical protein